MIELIQSNQLGLYACFFFLPFLQEDISILGAASACASGLGDPIIGFVLVCLGLSVSASLKYGLGHIAIRREWAQKYTTNTRVLRAGDSMKSNMGKSLYMARFMSPLRIPFYIGAGFFEVSFSKFLFFVTTSAALYVFIAFGLFHVFGEVAGDKMKLYIPVLAISILALYSIYFKIRTPRKQHEA